MTARILGREYAAIILDCDGVILDTNLAKVAAFQAAASVAGFDDAAVSAFSAWQTSNFGISRYRVFTELLNGSFGLVPETATLDGLIAHFAAEVREAYKTAPECNGLRRFLAVTSSTPRYVASGSDQAELVNVFTTRDLSQFFSGIHGSPAQKTQHVKSISAAVLSRNPCAHILMVGDAAADADAAQAAAVDFVFARRYSTTTSTMTERARREGFPVVEDLATLAALVEG